MAQIRVELPPVYIQVDDCMAEVLEAMETSDLATGRSYLVAVSYTHLTLPTNREV